MPLKTLVKKVINYNDIPKEVLGDFSFNLMRGEFAQQCQTYLEVHIDDKEDNTPLDEWFRKEYPELVEGGSFLIEFNPINLDKYVRFNQVVNNIGEVKEQTNIDTNIGDIKL